MGWGEAGEAVLGGGFSTSGSHMRCLLASSLVHYRGGGTACFSLCLVVGRGQGSRCPEQSGRARLTGLTRGIERGHDSEVWRRGGGHGGDTVFCPEFS